MANDDEIIEISFDDDEVADSSATSSCDGTVIDISFDNEDRPAATSRSVVSRGNDAASEDDVDDSKQFCRKCGFALPPLATECPRCARIGVHKNTSQAITPPEYTPVGSAPQYAPARQSCAFWSALASLTIIIVVAMLVAWYLVNSPGVRARAAYRAGVEAQLAGDMVTARAKYAEALEIDPQMGLAAFAAGTTFLGITVGSGTGQTLQGLLERATLGQTHDLDEADRWFDRAITLATTMPESRQLQDPNISTPAKLGAYAHAMKAITAFIRYVAALNAESFDVAGQWLGVASYEWQLCLQLDPENPYGTQLGGKLSPPAL